MGKEDNSSFLPIFFLKITLLKILQASMVGVSALKSSL